MTSFALRAGLKRSKSWRMALVSGRPFNDTLRVSLPGYYETHATKLRTFVEPVDPGPMWQMKKFAHVPGALETFRNARDKEASFKHAHSDKIGRDGTFGAGIYTSALN